MCLFCWTLLVVMRCKKRLIGPNFRFFPGRLWWEGIQGLRLCSLRDRRGSEPSHRDYEWDVAQRQKSVMPTHTHTLFTNPVYQVWRTLYDFIRALFFFRSFVGNFKSRKEREEELGSKALKFTNVYIKNFGEDYTDEKLKEVFSAFGETILQTRSSFSLLTDCPHLDREDAQRASDEGRAGTVPRIRLCELCSPWRRSEGTVCVCVFFSLLESCEAWRNFPGGWVSTCGSCFSQAVDEMNGTELNGKTIYVGRAQKRLERQGELKRKFELIKQDRIQRYQVLASQSFWDRSKDLLPASSKSQLFLLRAGSRVWICMWRTWMTA